VQNASYKNRDDDPRGPWKADNYVQNKTREERPNGWYAIRQPNTGEEIWPSPRAVWRYTKEQHERNVSENRVWWGATGMNKVPAYKRFLSEVGGVVPKTIWPHQEAGHNQDAVRELQAMFGESPFASPKPTKLMRRILDVAPGSMVLDFFAGSGTTGAAAIQCMRDGRDLQYVLVEMGEHFESVLKPRILKASYSSEWKGGVPTSRDGVSQIIKCIRIEAYEDALANLQAAGVGKLDLLPDVAREDYFVNYALSLSADQSELVPGLDAIDDPWAYRLLVADSGVSEVTERAIDLVETFSYLIGLKIESEEPVDGATVLRGTDCSGKGILAVWRRTSQVDNERLANLVAGQLASHKKVELVYANGPHTLDNLPGAGERFTVRQIDEDFMRLMFDTEDS